MKNLIKPIFSLLLITIVTPIITASLPEYFPQKNFDVLCYSAISTVYPPVDIDSTPDGMPVWICDPEPFASGEVIETGMIEKGDTISLIHDGIRQTFRIRRDSLFLCNIENRLGTFSPTAPVPFMALSPAPGDTISTQYTGLMEYGDKSLLKHYSGNLKSISSPNGIFILGSDTIPNVRHVCIETFVNLSDSLFGQFTPEKLFSFSSNISLFTLTYHLWISPDYRLPLLSISNLIGSIDRKSRILNTRSMLYTPLLQKNSQAPLEEDTPQPHRILSPTLSSSNYPVKITSTEILPGEIRFSAEAVDNARDVAFYLYNISGMLLDYIPADRTDLQGAVMKIQFPADYPGILLLEARCGTYSRVFKIIR